MQSIQVERFKDDLFYTLEEVSMHFEVYREKRMEDCTIISGVLTCSYFKSYDIEVKIYSNRKYIEVHIANKAIHCGLDTGELINQLCDLF